MSSGLPDTTPLHPGTVAGGGTLVRIEDQAGPFLAAWARTFPKEFPRALRSLGYWLKGEYQRAMRSGGRSVGQRWGQRSLVAQYKPFDRLRRSQFKKRRKSEATHEAGSLTAALGSASPLTRKGTRMGREAGFGSGKLQGRGGVAYRFDKNRLSLSVGFLNSSASYARMLQGGLLGEKKAWPFHGRQPVTDAMRKMFWAAGVPIAKDTKFIEAEPKPLVKPLFQLKRGEMLRRMELRLHAYVRGLSAKAATQYVQKNL